MGLSSFYYGKTESMGLGSFLGNSPEDSITSMKVRPPDVYPDQELKFLSQVVINCVSNIGDVESLMFGCEARSCIGILISTFFLKCLKKLREFHVSALKCMRYIMRAIDHLFYHENTRRALLVAMGIVFME